MSSTSQTQSSSRLSDKKTQVGGGLKKMSGLLGGDLTEGCMPPTSTAKVALGAMQSASEDPTGNRWLDLLIAWNCSGEKKGFVPKANTHSASWPCQQVRPSCRPLKIGRPCKVQCLRNHSSCRAGPDRLRQGRTRRHCQSRKAPAVRQQQPQAGKYK